MELRYKISNYPQGNWTIQKHAALHLGNDVATEHERLDHHMLGEEVQRPQCNVHSGWGSQDKLVLWSAGSLDLEGPCEVRGEESLPHDVEVRQWEDEIHSGDAVRPQDQSSLVCNEQSAARCLERSSDKHSESGCFHKYR